MRTYRLLKKKTCLGHDLYEYIHCNISRDLRTIWLEEVGNTWTYCVLFAMIIDFYRFLWICLKECTNKLGWKQETSGYSCFCCLSKKEKEKCCQYILDVRNCRS